MTDYSVAWSSTYSDYVLTLTGTDFDVTNVADVTFFIDDVKQTVLSVSDTEVQVRIVHLYQATTLNVKFYLPIGLPDGMRALTVTTGITVTPKLLSVSPHIGSPAGSVITITMKGVGPKTQGLLVHTSAHAEVCADLWVPEYGMIMCRTKAATIADGALMVYIGET